MKFSTIPAFVFATALCTLTCGGLAVAQGQRHVPSIRRSFTGGVLDFDELVVRTGKKSSGVNKAVVTASVQGVQKAQAARAQETKKKKTDNAKVQAKAVSSVNTKVNAVRDQVKKKPGPTDTKKLNAASDALRKSEKSRVAGQAQRDNKAKKTADWAAKVKTPDQKAATKAAAQARRAERKKNGEPSPANQVSSKPAPRSKDVKHNTKQQFQAAAKKLKETKGLPGRKEEVKVGDNKANGRAVRQSVFNSYLNSKAPVGRGDNKVPKNFRNERYAKDHKEESLQNTKPLPKGGKEYPVINNSPVGFTASNTKPGPLRTITYKKGGERHAAVIGHDPKRGSKDDHFVAT